MKKNIFNINTYGERDLIHAYGLYNNSKLSYGQQCPVDSNVLWTAMSCGQALSADSNPPRTPWFLFLSL